MADEVDVSEIVTIFICCTSRSRRQLDVDGVKAAVLCAMVAADRPPSDVDEAHIFIPLTTGSVGEFYIETMLSHFGDIDVMFHYSNELAIPRGHPPPTQLPAEFSTRVKVCEIVEDNHFPGYVYLESRYLLTESTDDDKYNYFETEHGLYLGFTDNTIYHGPALRSAVGLPIDLVPCIRCLSWPLQASDWPTRHRNYDWPDSATVDRVVSNGCDVVHVAHRQCRQDEWKSKTQWRLSFSRAEVVLLNSWTPVQQIVYHMLRVFVKTERLTDNEVLSNYNIKTLMLWDCELKSSRFLTDDVNLISICMELLHALSVSLADAQCPHYFISNCNLIENPLGKEMIISQLRSSINEAWLSWWFVKNYIQKCCTLCPQNVSSMFSDVSTNRKLLKVVSAAIEWRSDTALLDLWTDIEIAKFYIDFDACLYTSPLGFQSLILWLRKLSETNIPFHLYFTAVTFLHVAYQISSSGFTNELLDILAIIEGQFISTRHHTSQCSSELLLSKATKLMKVVVNSSHSTMQWIQIESSKAYLHRALRCKDSDSDSIYCLANVYLAVLYYTTGQYQTAIDHCTLVMRSQDHSQCSSRVVQGELLPKIDDYIDAVLGLAVLYQYIRTAALNQRLTQYVSVFTTELFAHYLNI